MKECPVGVCWSRWRELLWLVLARKVVVKSVLEEANTSVQQTGYSKL